MFEDIPLTLGEGTHLVLKNDLRIIKAPKPKHFNNIEVYL